MFRAVRGMVVTLAVWSAGCVGDKAVTGPAVLDPETPAFPAIVSNALGSAAAMGSGLAAAEAEVAYISLPPGALPGGEVATIRNDRTGATATTRVIGGGFDPVSVVAQAGDTLQVEVRVTGMSAVIRAAFPVPPRRRPVVVRTDPPPRKRDVPLNASLVIVFSEPLDPATLSPASVQLLRAGAPVEGTVASVPGTPWIAEFIPASPLALDTEYELAVTQDLRDLDGEPLDLTIIVPFHTSSDVVAPELTQVVAGGDHSCGLELPGPTYCWGDNSRGQLGDGSNVSSARGVWVSGPEWFVKLVAGDVHTCGLTSGGMVYCWGSNGRGQLGNGTTTSNGRPVTVSGGLRFVTIAAGSGDHTCGLTSDGAAYCWGSNDKSQLGDGTPPGASGSQLSTIPVPVVGDLRFTRITAGGSHTCGLTSSGSAYCWGANNEGQLGIGSPGFSPTPVAVSGGLSFDALTAGLRHTCGLTRSGAAYCWGANTDGGQLGDGTLISKSTPVPVTGGRTFTALAAGGLHTCGISRPAATFCWGVNNDGQLGNGSTANSSVPVAVSGGIGLSAVAGGTSHTCGFAKGVWVCWGNRYGTVPVGIRSVWDY